MIALFEIKLKLKKLYIQKSLLQAIIEDCRSVGFAPYSLSYTQLDDDFLKSGLSKEINNWNDIDDFNWLSTEKRSPNWHIVEENCRKNDWLL